MGGTGKLGQCHSLCTLSDVSCRLQHVILAWICSQIASLAVLVYGTARGLFPCGIRLSPGHPFSTYDADHDANEYMNIAEYCHSAGWMGYGSWSNLNGRYYPSADTG
ncbi:unnamed protein product, partial [Meganyctiphanes norvegica]